MDYSTSSVSEEIEQFKQPVALAVAMTDEERTRSQRNQSSRPGRAPNRNFCRLDAEDSLEKTSFVNLATERPLR